MLRIKTLPSEPNVTEVEAREAAALYGLCLRAYGPNPAATAVWLAVSWPFNAALRVC